MIDQSGSKMTFKILKKKLKICLIYCFLLFIIFIVLAQVKDLLRQDDTFITIYSNQEEKDFNDLRRTFKIPSDRLLNLTDFKFLINSNICEDYSENLLGLILVTSYVGHDHQRSAHRRAISQSELKGLGFLRIFILAKIPEKEKFITQSQIVNEQERFNDVIQGNFDEAYRNLTYKHLMGMKWAIEKCNKAKFVIKVDDDIVFDVFYLHKFLTYFRPSTNLYFAGYVLSNQRVIRNRASKWFVSELEYDGIVYPDYVSGWLYITNIATCSCILRESYYNNFFWIDDSFVTGILRKKLQIPVINLNEWFSANSQFLECCIKDAINYSYQCDYYVGPNGGDSNLIVSFVKQIQKCYLKSKMCKRRPIYKSLNLTCVGEIKNLLERDHGEAFIKPIRL